MGMLDLYNEEQAKEALEDAEATKKEFLKEIETINTMIFILNYFLKTGDALDPEAFGLEDLEEDDLDE